jgi:hypothetical protein
MLCRESQPLPQSSKYTLSNKREAASTFKSLHVCLTCFHSNALTQPRIDSKSSGGRQRSGATLLCIESMMVVWCDGDVSNGRAAAYVTVHGHHPVTPPTFSPPEQ